MLVLSHIYIYIYIPGRIKLTPQFLKCKDKSKPVCLFLAPFGEYGKKWEIKELRKGILETEGSTRRFVCKVFEKL